MIDKNKQYRTRDGREVRIYATDGGDGRLVHGAIKTGDLWVVTAWPSDDAISKFTQSGLDLIEVKPRIKREVWVNVYPAWPSGDIAWPSKKSADDGATPKRIACVRLTIDCEEGEGL